MRQGGASGGDDALALTISRVTRLRLSRSYLFTDLVVLGLSLSYIPAGRIFFSVVTVTTVSYTHLDVYKRQDIHSEEGEQYEISEEDSEAGIRFPGGHA